MAAAREAQIEAMGSSPARSAASASSMLNVRPASLIQASRIATMCWTAARPSGELNAGELSSFK